MANCYWSYSEKMLKFALIILLFGISLTFSLPFKSSIYYYSDPAVRQSGMAGVGYSLVRDEASVVLNPAILGISNTRFTKMSLQYSLKYDFDEQFNQNSLRNRVSIVSQVSPKVGGVYGCRIDKKNWKYTLLMKKIAMFFSDDTKCFKVRASQTLTAAIEEHGPTNSPILKRQRDKVTG